MNNEEFEYMDNEKFERLKRFVVKCKEKWYTKDIVAEIHNLWQEYLISDEQEMELYEVADPDEEFNEPADYWYDDCGCLPIWEFANR